MICMVPAAPYVSAQPNLADERRALVEAAATTTHWPQENQVASQGAPGQGVGSVRKLPSEARSLCLLGSHARGARRRGARQADGAWKPSGRFEVTCVIQLRFDRVRLVSLIRNGAACNFQVSLRQLMSWSLAAPSLGMNGGRAHEGRACSPARELQCVHLRACLCLP